MWVFLLVSGLVAVFSFSVVGPFGVNLDTEIYLSQISQFEAGALILEPYDVALRAFKPLYAVWGSFLVPLFSPEESIKFLNLLFLFLLPFVTFGFLKELGFVKSDAFWGALWTVTAYPVLKYGLAVGTDIAGWFFTIATGYTVLLALRHSSIRLLVLASFLGFLGASAKETGVFGLIFGGLYLIFTYPARGIQKTIMYLFALALPALALEGLLFGILMHAGFPTFIEWYNYAILVSSEDTRPTLFKFIAVEASTFNVMGLYAFFGALVALRGKIIIEHQYAKLIALGIASLPVLLWTMYISRIFFMQVIIVVPLALIGFRSLCNAFPQRVHGKLEIIFAVLPVASAAILFGIAGKGSLFTIFFS